MDLLEDLKMSLLSFNFVMIYIIQKILVFLKFLLNYLKDSIFECFLRSIITDFYFFFKKNIFSQHIMMESLSLEEKIRIKDIRNLFRLEKETKTIKDRILRYIENLFEHEE